jgi:SAM-dependent methyltransferase
MADTRTDHWQTVYTTKPAETVSWFQGEAAPSLAMIAAAGVGAEAAIIDIGAGASTLVDRLLWAGFHDLTALDVSAQALAVSQARLGDRATAVDWIAADLTAWSPAAHRYDLWHDRAVFHFLTDEIERHAYRAALSRALRPGGQAILATFAPTGPERCSGLPVQRYSAEALAREFGDNFELVASAAETHHTPAGGAQDFTWCRLRKRRD